MENDNRTTGAIANTGKSNTIRLKPLNKKEETSYIPSNPNDKKSQLKKRILLKSTKQKETQNTNQQNSENTIEENTAKNKLAPISEYNTPVKEEKKVHDNEEHSTPKKQTLTLKNPNLKIIKPNNPQSKVNEEVDNNKKPKFFNLIKDSHYKKIQELRPQRRKHTKDEAQQEDKLPAINVPRTKNQQYDNTDNMDTMYLSNKKSSLQTIQKNNTNLPIPVIRRNANNPTSNNNYTQSSNIVLPKITQKQVKKLLENRKDNANSKGR